MIESTETIQCSFEELLGYGVMIFLGFRLLKWLFRGSASIEPDNSIGVYEIVKKHKRKKDDERIARVMQGTRREVELEAENMKKFSHDYYWKDYDYIIRKRNV